MLMKPVPIPEPVIEEVESNGEDNGVAEPNPSTPEEQ